MHSDIFSKFERVSLFKGQNPGKKLYCTIVKRRKKKVRVVRNRVVEN